MKDLQLNVLGRTWQETTGLFWCLEEHMTDFIQILVVEVNVLIKLLEPFGNFLHHYVIPTASTPSISSLFDINSLSQQK